MIHARERLCKGASACYNARDIISSHWGGITMQQRIVTGVVGIAVAAALIQFGGYPFVLAVGVLMLLAWREYVAAFAHLGEELADRTGQVALTALMLAPLPLARQHNPWLLVALTLVCVYALLALLVFRHGKLTVPGICYSIVGVVYLGWGFAHFILLRLFAADVVGTVSLCGFPLTMTLGTQYLWLALLGTWSSDTFGYFVGVGCGRHPQPTPTK